MRRKVEEVTYFALLMDNISVTVYQCLTVSSIRRTKDSKEDNCPKRCASFISFKLVFCIFLILYEC